MGWKPNRNIKNIIRKALAEGLDDSAEVLKDKAVSNAPKDSGNLAKNIVVEKSDEDLTIKVVSKADYSAVVEFGSNKAAANPFLRSSIKESKNKMLKKFKGKL